MSDSDIVRNEPTAYKVRDAKSQLIAVHYRIDTDDGKQVWWTLPDGSKGLNGTPLAKLPLYGSEDVVDWNGNDLIVLVEGEKARDALDAAGLPALATVTGAGSTPGPEALEVLRSRRVCLWPDSDEPGEDHMQRIAETLQSIALEVLWFTWHEAPEDIKGADAADHPAVTSRNPKAVDRLLTNLESAPQWTPPEARAKQVGRLLSDVQAERVEWVWPGRIPKGKLSIWEGDPGVGKSAATTDTAAHVSVGRPWPDDAPCEAGGVVICSAEDGEADTIRPRLDAAGGDPSRVLALSTIRDGNGERLLSIPEDLEIIRRGIERVGAVLVIVDPFSAFLSGNHNAHKDQDVRRALAPLAKLAEETGAAIVVVRHLNKASGSNPLYRGGGSIGVIGAARSALLVAKHPEDEDRRVLAVLKSNLGPLSSSLAFSLAEATNGAVRVEWKGETSHTAATLLAGPVDPEERSALYEAKEFLRDALEGSPRWSKAVKKEGREASISEITLRRAKDALGIRSEKEADGWYWQLPESKGIKGGQVSKDDPLDPLADKGTPLESQEDQGDQEDQGTQLGSDERFAHHDGNRHRPGEHCIHDVPNGCWLCKKKTSEGSEQVLESTT